MFIFRIVTEPPFESVDFTSIGLCSMCSDRLSRILSYSRPASHVRHLICSPSTSCFWKKRKGWSSPGENASLRGGKLYGVFWFKFSSFVVWKLSVQLSPSQPLGAWTWNAFYRGWCFTDNLFRFSPHLHTSVGEAVLPERIGPQLDKDEFWKTR